MDINRKIGVFLPAWAWAWLAGFIAASVQPGVQNNCLDELQAQINEALKQ